MKKIFCVLVFLVIGISSIVAIAENSTYENFIIEETEDAVIIRGCVDTTVTEIYVPGYINGKKVELAPRAFSKYEEYENLESIAFGEGIEIIPESLCGYGYKLKNIEFSSTVKIIKKSAFSTCQSLTEVDLKNVEVVEGSAFGTCDALIKVTSNGKLKEVKARSFAWSEALEEFNFTGVEYIGNRAFVGTNLKSIYLPDLKDWDGIATEDVDEESMRHKRSLSARYPLKTSPLEFSNNVGTPFVLCHNLKTVRIKYPENGNKSYKSLFTACENIENVIFENFPAEPSKWEFYNTTEVVEKLLPDGYIHPPQSAKPPTSERRYLMFEKPEFKFTIYGKGEAVKAYAEKIGVPFKEIENDSLDEEDIEETLEADEKEISININGTGIECDSAPYIKNDRTMVPMRAIFEALGASVSWDAEMRTAIGVKGDTEVKITIGENELYKNGEAIELDAPAEIAKDRTMVPVRAISEAFGCTVNWNDETKTVEITN